MVESRLQLRDTDSVEQKYTKITKIRSFAARLERSFEKSRAEAVVLVHVGIVGVGLGSEVRAAMRTILLVSPSAVCARAEGLIQAAGPASLCSLQGGFLLGVPTCRFQPGFLWRPSQSHFSVFRIERVI